MLPLASISIVKTTPAHLPGIVNIENQTTAPWSLGQIETELALSHGWQFVALHPDSKLPIGFIFGSTTLDEAEIRKIAVSTELRRHGVGRKLLRHSLDFLYSHQIQYCFLELRQSNKNALALYTQFGFQKIGLRKSYYINPPEHAIILKKLLSHKGGNE